MAHSRINWMERLSLDAVCVALAWGWVLSHLAFIPPDAASAAVLGLSTWLTYVADRLWDVRPGRPVPPTDRHQFYGRHYRVFLVLWCLVLPLSISIATWLLPLWKWALGWGLVAVITVYLFLLGKALNPSQRLLLKRTAVPLIFALGTGWMAESWRNGSVLLANLVLLAGAWINVLMISLWEGRRIKQPGWLQPAVCVSLGMAFGLSVVLIILHQPTGVAAIVMTALYGMLFRLVRHGYDGDIRLAADAVLLVPALLLLASFLF